MKLPFFCCLLLFCAELCANTTPFLSAGVEVCRMKRMRDGGTQQEGCLSGARLSYNRVTPCCLYLGADYFAGSAKMLGHSGSQRPIASVITDSILEGRFGYVFPVHSARPSFFALFTGYGFFKEMNSFNYPTPYPIEFKDTFSYIPLGFLSGIQLYPRVSIGLNFKTMFMLNGESLIYDDIFNTQESVLMNNEMNVRIEVPLLFSPTKTLFNISFALVPFLELRHFGGREGYPYDFLDTKFNLLGGRLSFVYYF